MPHRDDLLDRKDLAVSIRRSERCVTDMVTKGVLPPGILFGSRRVWVWGDVLDYIRENSPTPE